MWSLGSSSSDHQSLANIVTGCSTSNHTDYLSHDANTWKVMRQAYYNAKNRQDEDWHSDNSDESNSPNSGMKVPFEVRINPKNGLRQVMVTRDIPAGYTLWQPIHYETFTSEHEYVEFLQELPHHLQCDALSWTHSSWYNKEHYVDITLDEGTFILESSSSEDINIDIDCVTLREIKAGEFVFMNHTDYFLPRSESPSLHFAESGVEWFDDIRSTAWKRTGLGMGRSNHGSRTNQNQQRQQQTPLASGLAVLSMLYLIAKAMRSKKHRDSISHQSLSYRHDDSAYGASYFYTQKRKLA